MATNRTFHSFNSNRELIDYLHRWNLLAATKNTVPNFYYRKDNLVKKCNILGFENTYDTWSTIVIDYGNGPHFIHTDLFRDMQTTPERQKGTRLLNLPESYIIFDLETTSLSIYDAEIIQISAIKISNNNVIDTFDSYVKPNNPIPNKITKLTGISDLTVCMSPSIDIVLPQFFEFIGDSCLAGFNIHSYDTNIIYDNAKSLLDLEFKNDYFDFYYFFKDHLDKSLVTNYKLVTICDYYNIDTTESHNALTAIYASTVIKHIFLRNSKLSLHQSPRRKTLLLIFHILISLAPALRKDFIQNYNI